MRRLAATARPVDAVALEVAARLNQPRRVSLPELSSATGLSERQLHRRYSDQQHLAHEVRAIMGTTPARLLRSADV